MSAPPRATKSGAKGGGETCKLAMLGAPGVGKSGKVIPPGGGWYEVGLMMGRMGRIQTRHALVVRFLTRRFIWEYDPTLEYTYRHSTVVDEEPVVLEILDTAGQDASPYYEGHLKWGEGFMLVYSVTDRQSFAEVKAIRRYLDDVRRSRHVSCVVVGNKSDLEQDRCVTSEEGERLAGELACAFYETSACDGSAEITEAFQELYREVRRRKMMEGKSRRRSSAAQVKNVLGKMFTKINNG